MYRRLARSLVLALFLLALAGPWDRQGGHGSSSVLDFWDLVGEVLFVKRDWLSVLLVGVMAVPVACLATILAPSSRHLAIAYRVLLGPTAVSFLALFSSHLASGHRRPPWGASLYVVALVLASVVEIGSPRRRPPPLDAAGVFR